MVTIRQQLDAVLDELNEAELEQLAEFAAFIRFRNRASRCPIADSHELAALYGEFADEDRQLSECGVDDYRDSLAREDVS